ncbi:MAG: class I SAM-dependent methyltransferase, partial [Leptolyngbyaceae cyanobacterium bins.59]|nr:class I SAM-dependent methyltransferase [Leptolyngbyaceae cyanobacterium bins.59]
MRPDEVAQSYDQIANVWNSEAFPRTDGVKQHERAIAFVKERQYALDIGCGCSGRIIDLLMGYGFSVEGIDISGRMIELAKQRHPDVTFHHADICNWPFPRTYNFISAWDSIWHLPLQDHEMVLKRILQALTPQGICIFTAGGLDAPTEKVDFAMGPQMYYSVLGIPKMLKVLSDTGCVCRHLEYDQYPEQHL